MNSEGILFTVVVLLFVGNTRGATDDEKRKYWEEEMKKYVTYVLQEFKEGAPNKQVADDLYALLKEKFGWRNWYVVVYNAVSGDDKQYVRTGSGSSVSVEGYEPHSQTWFDVKGRNVIITSDIEGDSKPLNEDFVKENIKKMHSGRLGKPWFWGFTKKITYNAHELFDRIPKSLEHIPCDDSAFFETGRGFIEKSADPQYRAPEGHYIIQDIGSYKFHLFGHCIHWWTDDSGTKRSGSTNAEEE